MNKEHPNFGQKTKIGADKWWKMLIAGKYEIIILFMKYAR